MAGECWSWVPKVPDEFPETRPGRPGPALRSFRHNVACALRALRGDVGAFLSSARIVAFNSDLSAAQVYATFKITPQSQGRHVISSHRKPGRAMRICGASAPNFGQPFLIFRLLPSFLAKVDLSFRLTLIIFGRSPGGMARLAAADRLIWVGLG